VIWVTHLKEKLGNKLVGIHTTALEALIQFLFLRIHVCLIL